MDQNKILRLIHLYSNFFDKIKYHVSGGLHLTDPIYYPVELDIRDFMDDFSFEEMTAAGFCLSSFICNSNYKIKYNQKELISLGYKIENIKFIEDFIFFCGLPKPHGCTLKNFLQSINPDFLNIKKLREIGISCRDLKKINDIHSPWVIGPELFPIEEIIKEYSIYELDINLDKNLLKNYDLYHIKSINHIHLAEIFLSSFIRRKSYKKYQLKKISGVLRRALLHNPESNSRIFLANVFKRRIAKNCFDEYKKAIIKLQSFFRRKIKRKVECDICKCILYSFDRINCSNDCNYCYDCLENLVNSELKNILSGTQSFIIYCGICKCSLSINELLFVSKSICKEIMKVWWELGEAMGHESFHARYIEMKEDRCITFLDPRLVPRWIILDEQADYDFQQNPDFDKICSTLLKINEENIINYFDYLRYLSFGKGEEEELKIITKKYEIIFQQDPTFFYVDDIQSRILNPRCPKCKTIIYWFDGCFAIECKCKNYICGWCLEFYGTDEETHKHVMECQLSFHRGDLYGKFQEFEWVNTMRCFFRFHYYLITINSKSIRDRVRQKIIDSNKIMDPEIFYQTSLFLE